jgi:hypothetical protein
MLPRRDANVVSVNAIVIDPEVPEGPKRWLTEADRRRREAPPHGPVGTYTFRHRGTSVYRREDDREYGLLVPELIPFADPTPRLDPPSPLQFLGRALRPRLRESYEQDNAAVLYHRRYVCPSRDLDANARQSWQRAIVAAEKVSRSDVVRQQLIDSVRVTTVLPYHLWDIAERLAELSALRADHEIILDGVAHDDPDVAVVLDPQRRAHELAADDIERRVRDLEVFACRVEEADAARRREEAVRRLADLNDIHRDLLARVGSPSETLGSDLPAPHELQAVIDQANKAIRAANEAGRSLVLPSASLNTEAAGEVGGEDAVGVQFGADLAELLQARVHLLEHGPRHAGVLGEVDATAVVDDQAVQGVTQFR